MPQPVAWMDVVVLADGALRAMAKLLSGVWFDSFGRSRVRVIIFALLIGGTAVAAENAALPAVDDKWRHYRSTNFELFSRNAEGDSRQLLHHLELLRKVCLERFNFIERARVEVTVYYFRTLADFQAYSVAGRPRNDFFKGYYLARPDRAVIALAPIDGPDGAQRIIFHEYVHHLFRTAEQDPPVWFGEGMAELLAGMRVAGDRLEIGWPNTGRLAVLRREKLLPLETLFAVDHQSPIYRSNDHTGLFYAESWALMHYWHFGDSGLAEEAVARFLKAAGNKKSEQARDLRGWFKECFGMDYAEMERRLEQYISTGSFRYGRQPLPKLEPASTYAVRAVTRDEIRVRLAELSLRVNRAALAKLVLLEAIEKNPSDPRPFESLGLEALMDRDENGARDRWEQAVLAGTTNVAIYRELGLLESRAWFQQFDYNFRLSRETTERLRARLGRSIEYAPDQSAAYEMLAWIEAFSEDPSIANINLVQTHFPSLQRQPRTLLALALVRARLSKPDDARALLDQLDRMNPDDLTAYAAEIIRAKLDGRPARRPASTAVGKGKSGPIAPPPPLKIPSLVLPGAP